MNAKPSASRQVVGQLGALVLTTVLTFWGSGSVGQHRQLGPDSSTGVSAPLKPAVQSAGQAAELHQPIQPKTLAPQASEAASAVADSPKETMLIPAEGEVTRVRFAVVEATKLAESSKNPTPRQSHSPTAEQDLQWLPQKARKTVPRSPPVWSPSLAADDSDSAAGDTQPPLLPRQVPRPTPGAPAAPTPDSAAPAGPWVVPVLGLQDDDGPDDSMLDDEDDENVQEVECPAFSEMQQSLRSITEISADISPKRFRTDAEGEEREEKFPPDCAREYLAELNAEPIVLDLPRGYVPAKFYWQASNLKHNPLYFEDINLERYGHTVNEHVQPYISAARFYATIPFLPYKMVRKHPHECVYALGYYRPGSCAPFTRQRLIVPDHPKAGVVQGLMVIGLIVLIP